MEHARTLALTSVQPIRWGDMDALGHVNNTIYFRYMETARVEWMESFGYRLDTAQAEGVVIVNASCTFIKPLVYPGQVEVRVFFGPPGRSSLPSHYEIRKVGEDALYAEGAAKIVWINQLTGKSAPLPPHVLRRLGA